MNGMEYVSGKKAANREIGVPGDTKAANQEIGVPRNLSSKKPKWHSREYLPHFDGGEAQQHVTFHLADSLPKSVVEQLEREINAFPLENQDIERRKRVEIWIDAGYGSCVLHEPFVAAMVQESLLHFDGQRYRLLEWVVMPNHVHVLFQPINGWTVAKIVASWKKFTARGICDYRRTMNANQEIGVPGKIPAVWHREYWDRFIRNDLHYQEAVDYIHENPVKAGLATTVKDWPWSSAVMSQSKK